MDLIPPYDLDAERSLLGAILADNTCLPEVVEKLRGDEFYRPSHQKIFAAVRDLFSRNEPADLVTVSEAVDRAGLREEIGGYSYLASLYESVGSSSNACAYAKIVVELHQLRSLMNSSREIAAKCSSRRNGETVKSILELAESKIFEITGRSMKGKYSPVSEIVRDSIPVVEDLARGKIERSVLSGFSDLDKLMRFKKSNLIVIGARPSMGKTALALNIARNAARMGNHVGFFSLEMSKEELVFRLLCSEARVDSKRAGDGIASEGEYAKILAAAPEIEALPLYIDDTPGITPLELRAKARRMMSDHGLSMLIVDYLQLMHGPEGRRDTREQEISDISRSLKELAKDMHIPVVALAQLNRKLEERSDKRPILSDLRESGSLEQDADIVAFIYRHEVYNQEIKFKGLAEILVRKQRNGPTGTVGLVYIAKCTRFESLSYGG